jgi:DNA phosphorothioation system restriction enzyme
MNLKSFNFPLTLNTSDNDIIADFFVPALNVSVRYDRGVGFFSAGWLQVSAEGMASFARNSGYARWVTSPILSEDDWEALQLGQLARNDKLLRKAIERNLNELEQALKQETLSTLAWLVADKVLDFKIALPRNKLGQGDFHDKFGVFTDAEGNQVSFNGSYNDSIQGIRNYESIKIFCSWESSFTNLVQTDADRFKKLWANRDPNVAVFDLPEAARAQIVRLRTQERPYPQPADEKSQLLRNRQILHKVHQPVCPCLPSHIDLRDYQEDAVEAWFAHDCLGLLEMATGTGKTITALAASVRLFNREKRLAVIIAVPYQHLVDQWKTEAKSFGYRPILAYQNKSQWLDKLNTQIVEFNGGYRDFLSVITTHTTFISAGFQGSITRLGNPSLLIADECHHLGAERSRQNYPTNVPFRLALSATPVRWFDDIGTAALRTYFGETVFSFPLEKAIGVSLTPYYYYPHLVSLTHEEMERYQDLSTRIAQLIDQEKEESQEALKMLLIRRARLLNGAERKVQTLAELVDAQVSIDHTLFYCAPGQIDHVMHLLGWEKGLRVHRFTAQEDTRERQRLLDDFASGDLQALVAMKCLDEGVDVPSTRTAYILASSSNPREFVQRRGRILRMSPGKEFSVIHDLVAVPPTAWAASHSSPTFEAERSIIRRELKRFKEFADPAKNKHQALDVIWDIAERYRLLDF